MWCNNPVDVFRLTLIAMSDFNPFDVIDAVYLYGNTPDNEVSILEAGLAIYNAGLTSNIGICGGGPYRPPNSPPDAKIGYSGAAVWQRWLVKRGVRESDIFVIPRPELSHTGTEAFNLVRLAKDCAWKVISVVACPVHMPRAFTNTVALILREYPELLAYAQPGTPLAWDQVAVSSQGNVFGTRIDDGVESEWQRVNKIHGNQYDVTDGEEVINYLKRRDALAKELLQVAR